MKYMIQSLRNNSFGTSKGCTIAIDPTTTVIINKLAPINSETAKFNESDLIA